AYDLTRHTAPAGDRHIDHIHISLGWPGALAQTSFYTGSTGTAATGCQPDSAGCPARRLGGTDRYATSVAIGQAAYPTSSAVVIASGEDAHLVDGLVAAPLGRSLQAPVLLTQVGGLPTSVAAEVTRRAPATACLVGGTAAVGSAVAAQLTNAGIRVVRLAGADRYATAAAIARQVGAGAGTAVVAPGADDQLLAALLAGGPAAALSLPVLLTGPGAVPAATTQAMAALGVRSTYVVGGVPSAAATSLPAPTVLQAPGVYALSALLADTFAGQVDPAEVALASGAPANLVDSLPGGVLGRIILLTAPSALTASSRTWLTDHPAVGTVTVLGGTGAVSDLSARAAAAAVTR
ncbi:MAG TPA: cell wall-binding repeat-containing protein, partial [Actinomycetes bacterium]